MRAEPHDDALGALNAERLRQWGDRLTDEGAAALLVLGVNPETLHPTVLWPDKADTGDIIHLLLHAANWVALLKAMNEGGEVCQKKVDHRRPGRTATAHAARLRAASASRGGDQLSWLEYSWGFELYVNSRWDSQVTLDELAALEAAVQGCG